MPLVNPPMFGQAFSMLEYLDTMRETRTGVTRYNQGLDASSLNKTASGITQIMGASQQRLDMIARLFAEDGVKTLFQMVHALVRKYSDNQEIIRLRNKYIAVDPRGWRKRTDLTISVGLGTGNKDQMLGHLTMILQAQEKAAMSGMGLVTPKNIHYALKKLTENAGFKDAEEFWNDPEGNQQPQQPQIPPELQKQMQDGMQTIQKQQQEIQQLQAKINAMQANVSADIYKTDKQAEVELMKVQLQNESKEMLASTQMVVDSLMQSQKAISDSQQQIASKVQEVDEKEIDFGPVMEALQVIQAQIQGTQPVGIKQIRDESGRLIGGVRVLADGTEQEISIQ
jgi:hypothetical protein